MLSLCTNAKPAICIMLLGFVFLAACESELPRQPVQFGESPPVTDPGFRIDGTLDFIRADGERYATIDIEIADTEEARRQGLMYRTSIPENTGMLFIFEREEPQSFWMANTPLSLDMIFADSDGRIVNIARYTRPFSHENVRSQRAALYVVEVRAGFSDRRGVVEGDRIEWRRHER